MINPMMVMTTRISTSVKPACDFRDRRRLAELRMFRPTSAISLKFQPMIWLTDISAVMTDPLGGVDPDRGGSRGRHHVDQNPQRRGEIDAASEQDPKIAAE